VIDPEQTSIQFQVQFVCVRISALSDHLNGISVTNNSPPTVNSYSVHEDELKWFDVPLVAGGKAALLHGDLYQSRDRGFAIQVSTKPTDAAAQAPLCGIHYDPERQGMLRRGRKI
jgi:hypothetical protein